jgi:O-antigen/teichoic acid export membrane protein
MQRKLLNRGATIIQNTFNSLLLPVFNVAVSALVVRVASAELWGAFVAVLVVVQFGAHVVAWGNKDYLLREFSRHPNQIDLPWQTGLVTRAAVFAALCPLLLAFEFPLSRLALVILWGLGLVAAQSYEVLILYRRDFTFAILTETVAAAGLILTILLLGSDLSVDMLIGLFAAAQFVRTAAFAVRFRGVLRDFRPHISARYLRLAAPFLLLSLSGLLSSRIDLYAVSYFLPERAVGEYQIFINLMIYLQAIANFVILPYVKAIYRLDDSAIFKIVTRLFLLGALLLIPALPGAYWLLGALYDIHYPAEFLLLGGALVLPVYAYAPLVYRLHKRGQQRVVLKISLLGAAANLTLNMILLPRIGAVGGILASAAMQWGIMIFYIAEACTSRAIIKPRTL